MTLIRTFIAIELPENIRENIAGIQEKLKSLQQSVRWVKPENIHLTLKFLGNIPEIDIDGISEIVKIATDGYSPFSIEVKNSGAFPSINSPRVIWIGIENTGRELINIQRKIDLALEKKGIPKDDRPFRPHLTIGRVKGNRDRDKDRDRDRDKIRRALDEVRDKEFGSILVDRIYVYKSDLRPEGPIYTTLREIPLA